ncbi:hypothetical protein F5Y07DRAFT_137954 [Xylaria sp. FL0933]|nr:hypothetical protein F5Y07DRAFT_137954 [Xylaria sp. FL0933]
MDTSKASIGVELEFLIGLAVSDQPINIPERFRHGGAPLILPPGLDRYDNPTEEVREILGRTIKNALSGLHALGDRVVQSEEEAAADDESLHLRQYVDWTIKSDESVVIVDDTDHEKYMGEYEWFPAEVCSPALWVTEASWEEIRVVIQAIKDEFWIITPVTAGIHYHYGHGKDYLPFQKLRRIAALAVAVDPLMAQLHPEHRRDESFCLSNRLYSRVAHGRTAAATAEDLNVGYIEAEPEVPGPEDRPKPFPRPSYMRTPSLTVPFKRGELTGYKLDRYYFRNSGYAKDNIGQCRPCEIPLAVTEILQCQNAPTVAGLMRYSPEPKDRPAYNFRAYTNPFYKKIARIPNGEMDRYYQHKRTVEFRQMESTMEAEEVVAHGKIIVRLCEFAAEADLAKFWKVVLDCTVAEDHGDWYDVFDLLAELGLTSEAKVLQRAVARFRGESGKLAVGEEHDEGGEDDELHDYQIES